MDHNLDDDTEFVQGLAKNVESVKKDVEYIPKERKEEKKKIKKNDADKQDVLKQVLERTAQLEVKLNSSVLDKIIRVQEQSAKKKEQQDEWKSHCKRNRIRN
eukprot:10109153-Ditylum_brightwellii.AAC.1